MRAEKFDLTKTFQDLDSIFKELGLNKQIEEFNLDDLCEDIVISNERGRFEVELYAISDTGGRILYRTNDVNKDRLIRFCKGYQKNMESTGWKIYYKPTENYDKKITNIN